MTAALDAVVAEAIGGGRPETVLLMRLLAEAASEDQAREALARASDEAGPDGRDRLDAIQALWVAHPQAWTLVRSVLDGVAHQPQGIAPDEALLSWATVFDRLAAAAPEAGVALYSLGDPSLLAAATQEIVSLMARFELLGQSRDMLDLGCGIGRLVVALAPRMRNVVGIDISAGMVAEARLRSAALGNTRIVQGNGRDLDGIADASIDVVLAADVFPYLVQVGGELPERHFLELSRILRPGGAALILNYSYRGDPEADRTEVDTLAAGAGLIVVRNGTRDLDLWDAPTFLLRKDVSP